MRAGINRNRDAVAGFTMVEALVTMALMGLMMAALATVTAQWLPNWNQGFVQIERAELLEAGIERLAADISAAEFVSAGREIKGPLFDGSEQSITFVRSALGPNTRPGLEIVRIGEAADSHGPVLVRARARFTPGAAGDQAHFTDPVVLLRTPYRVSFSYAGKDTVWKSEWRGANTLPAAVRIIIRNGASDRTLPVSTAVTIRTELPADCAGDKGGSDCPGAGGSPAAATGTAGGDTAPILGSQ